MHVFGYGKGRRAVGPVVRLWVEVVDVVVEVVDVVMWWWLW